MAFPIYFIAGAVVGAVATYIYKDDKTREKLTDTGNKLKNGANAFMTGFRQKPEQPPAQAVPKIEDEAQSRVESVGVGTTDDAESIKQ